METLKLTHVAGVSSVDSDDPVASGQDQAKVVAKALRALAAKLDADATVTDIDYLATIDAITL
jgi:hypothetical protein